MSYFTARNISKSFQNKKVIENISITLNKGEWVSLLGISGIGKTTLFNILSGFLSPDTGSVTLKGNDITNQMGKLSYMQQDDLLLEHKTILDNVALPLMIQGQKKEAARKKAMPFFKIFGLEGSSYKYPCQLSGGMRQRAALLRTYLFSDEVFLLDEPFSALDPLTKEAMHSWFIDIIKRVKGTTLFITHDIDEAIFLSDRIYILSGSPGIISKEISFEGIIKDKDFFFTQKYLDIKKEIMKSL